MSKSISLIKASAGSGKTYELMNRLSECIKNGIEPEKLFATTFTVKAAAELQSRIRQCLIADGKPELASRVFDGLIGTVDGICGRLLSEYAIEAGLSPALDVIAEDDIDAIFNASLSTIYNVNGERTKVIDEAALRIGALVLHKTEHNNVDWRDEVKKVTEAARNNRLGKDDLQKCCIKSTESVKSILKGCIDYSLNDIKIEVEPLSRFVSNIRQTQTVVSATRDFITNPTWDLAAKLSKCEGARTDEDFDNEILRRIGGRILDSRQLYQDVCTVIEGVFFFAELALESYSHYKDNMGLVDFVDQECRTLDLFEKNEKFRDLMKERLSVAMVDEFQDTSPVQLALFLKINEFTKNGSIWAGDPKQAIYGFRGTDPSLMDALSSSVPKEYISTLKHSWRSRENLVRLSNEIFKRTFSDLKEEEIILEVPEDRKEKAKDGDIEAWYINGNNKQHRMASLACGIRALIAGGVKPQDIGVLMRSNESCSALASALSSLGIPASASSGNLMDTDECRIVMSAFRYCVNHNDTASLAVICAYLGKNNDILNMLIKEKGDGKFTSLRNMDFLQDFYRKADATPLEILDYVITKLELDKVVSGMKYPKKRIQNIEKLRTVCLNYMHYAQVHRCSATPSGFIAYATQGQSPQAEGFGEGTVNVLTYHKAKGLQWPVVVLCSLDSDTKSNAFGVHVTPAENFDVNNPLAGRSINYWPKPFGSKQNTDELKKRLYVNNLQKDVSEKEREESRRLMYVGITRAESTLIFALERGRDGKTRTTWLDNLSDFPFIKFPESIGNGKLSVGSVSFDIIARQYDGSENSESVVSVSSFVDNFSNRGKIHYPASKNPSSAEENDGSTKLVVDFSSRMNVSVSDDCYNLLGNAIHNYIAINPKENKIDIADRILKNWTVEDVVSLQDVADCTDRLYDWIKKNYQGCSVECEVPMSYTNEHGTVCQGYIDMLLEMPDYYIIIDHKTHGNLADSEYYAVSCVGQLRLYKKAVEETMHKSVKQLLIYMPVLGKIYEIC